MNSLKLPEGFSWRLTAQPSKEYARLVYLETEIAVIRRLGEGWIAVINEGFSCPDFRACVLPREVKAQRWLATWARHHASLVHAVCTSKKCEKPQQQWLSWGFTPLCSAL